MTNFKNKKIVNDCFPAYSWGLEYDDLHFQGQKDISG
jgi:hypothetical protein